MQKSKFRSLQCVEMVDFVLFESQKSISRKFWLIEKLWIFYTVSHSENCTSQGVSFVWNFTVSNGCSTKWYIFDPVFGKTNWKMKTKFPNPKKIATSQTHSGFTNMGSNIDIFRVTAIWNIYFPDKTPCKVSENDHFHISKGWIMILETFCC